METRYLLCDVYSNLYYEKSYGKKGDKVVLISTRGDIAIVENQQAERFSVNVKKISLEKVATIIETVPPVETKQNFKPAPVKKRNTTPVKKQKAVPANQTNLF